MYKNHSGDNTSMTTPRKNENIESAERAQSFGHDNAIGTKIGAAIDNINGSNPKEIDDKKDIDTIGDITTFTAERARSFGDKEAHADTIPEDISTEQHNNI